jgi:hypothetical protein
MWVQDPIKFKSRSNSSKSLKVMHTSIYNVLVRQLTDLSKIKLIKVLRPGLHLIKFLNAAKK